MHFFISRGASIPLRLTMTAVEISTLASSTIPTRQKTYRSGRPRIRATCRVIINWWFERSRERLPSAIAVGGVSGGQKLEKHADRTENLRRDAVRQGPASRRCRPAVVVCWRRRLRTRTIQPKGAVMRIYQAVAKALEGIGVDTVFGGAGENDATLLLALKHSTKIRAIITRNEQAAAFMACGYALYSRRLGVCFATAGPGAFNLFSGLAVAMSDSHPVLAISGFANTEWRGKGALNETSGVHRTPDSQAMFAATTKRAFLLERP